MDTPDFWNDVNTLEPLDMFSPTPAPTGNSAPDGSLAATPLPAELVPQNPRNVPFTFPPQFRSSADIMTASAEKPEAVEDEDEYSGPAPTGRGIVDLLGLFGLPPSFATLFEDMQDAIVGITGDLTGSTSAGGRESLAEILTHNNRLRGIGALFVLIAVVALVVDGMKAAESLPKNLVTAAVEAALKK